MSEGRSEAIGRALAGDGTELVLYRRGDDYQIRADGLELVSTRAHGSEEALARLACAGIDAVAAPRILIGGLGFGYTLRATLEAAPASARIVVSELFPAVVDWNRGPVAHLARRPLEDPRVELVVGDVRDQLRSKRGFFDAVLLDVDNGPGAPTLSSNLGLYSRSGLAAIARALVPEGILAIWSADPSPALLDRLSAAGWRAQARTVAAVSDGSGPKHTIFLARK